MTLYKYLGFAGGMAGLGFGIFASVKNFNPDAHQAEEMAQAQKIFSELLTQIGMAGLQACTLALLSGMAGGLIDLISYFNSEKEEYLIDLTSSDTEQEYLGPKNKITFGSR